MKKTEKSANGTSFHDVTITTTINDLTRLLGEPTYTGDPYEDKVSIEWVCETVEGYVITIYDWKEYRRLEDNELVEFHLGGQNKMHTLIAKDEIIDNLKTYFSVKVIR